MRFTRCTLRLATALFSLPRLFQLSHHLLSPSRMREREREKSIRKRFFRERMRERAFESKRKKGERKRERAREGLTVSSPSTTPALLFSVEISSFELISFSTPLNVALWSTLSLFQSSLLMNSSCCLRRHLCPPLRVW